MSLLLCQASCWKPHARNTKVGQLDEASCVCVCVCVSACTRPCAQGCVRGQLFSSAACSPAPETAPLCRTDGLPGFQLCEQSRRNSCIETPSLRVSNSVGPEEPGSRSRVPGSPAAPGRAALEGCEAPGSGPQRPPRGRPARGCGPGAQVGGGQVRLSAPSAGAVQAALGGRGSPFFLMAGSAGPASQLPAPRVLGTREDAARVHLPRSPWRPPRPGVRWAGRQAAAGPPFLRRAPFPVCWGGSRGDWRPTAVASRGLHRGWNGPWGKAGDRAPQVRLASLSRPLNAPASRPQLAASGPLPPAPGVLCVQGQRARAHFPGSDSPWRPE